MHTTISLVEELCKHFDNCSDYALAPKLEIHKNTISGWRTGRNVMNEATARKASEILGYSEEEVLISLAAERAKGTPAEQTWENIFNQVAA